MVREQIFGTIAVFYTQTFTLKLRAFANFIPKMGVLDSSSSYSLNYRQAFVKLCKV